MRFLKSDNLGPRFISHFEIWRRVGDVAYELALPRRLSTVHLVFHVSMLCLYILDDFYVISYDSVELGSDLA